MLGLHKISGTVDFVGSIIFSIAVIFFCCFSMFSIMNYLSKNDISDLANADADTIVSTITGISIDEDAISGKLSNGVHNIIYSIGSKDKYAFSDAISDAKDLISDTLGDVNMTAAVGNDMGSTKDSSK